MAEKHRFLTFCVFSLLLVGFSCPSYAEVLDDASIRKVFADEVALGHEAEKTKDAKKIQAYLNLRLDDNYTCTTNTVDTMDNEAPENGKENYNKAQTIANAAENLSITNVEKDADTITDIKYSDDHKFAYVASTSTSSGTMTTPDASGRPVHVHFDDADSCVEKMTLIGATIKYLQSACDDKLIVKRQ